MEAIKNLIFKILAPFFFFFFFFFSIFSVTKHSFDIYFFCKRGDKSDSNHLQPHYLDSDFTHSCVGVNLQVIAEQQYLRPDSNGARYSSETSNVGSLQ